MITIYESILRRILIESRVSDAKAKYPNVAWKIDILSKKLNEKQYRFLPWAAKQLNDNPTLSIDDLVNTLVQFDKNLQRMSSKDIESYNTLSDLEKEVLRATSVPSKTQQHKDIATKETDRVYESDRFLVVVPKSTEASCKYGAGTKWCVSGQRDNKFAEYSTFVVIAVVMDKKNREKYAYVLVPDKNNNIVKTEIFDSRDKKLSDVAFEDMLGKEFTSIQAALQSYVKQSKRGEMSEEKAWDMVNSRDIEQRITIAKSDHATQEMLEKLSTDKEEDVRIAVAENENVISRKVFENLVEDECDDVRRTIAFDKNLPNDLVMKLLKDDDDTVRRHALSNPNVGADTLRKLAKLYKHTSKLSYSIARNTSTPTDVLDDLASNPSAQTRLSVAENKNTSKETLEKLVNDSNAEVRETALKRIDVNP